MKTLAWRINELHLNLIAREADVIESQVAVCRVAAI
jgi:hypothetical protein